MTVPVVKRPNVFALAIGGLLSGAGLASWFALFHFTDKWRMNGPRSPTAGYVYAHVEHGGLNYFNAIQSTGSHLYIPIWISLAVGLLIAKAAYGENAVRRKNMTQDDVLVAACQIGGAVLAVTVIYLFGHDILNALINSPFGPGNDDLKLVDR